MMRTKKIRDAEHRWSICVAGGSVREEKKAAQDLRWAESSQGNSHVFINGAESWKKKKYLQMRPARMVQAVAVRLCFLECQVGRLISTSAKVRTREHSAIRTNSWTIWGKKKVRITHVASLLLVPGNTKNDATVAAHITVYKVSSCTNAFTKNVLTTSRQD